jgi:hypothetical protein
MNSSTYPNTPASPQHSPFKPHPSRLARLAGTAKRGFFYTLTGFFTLITGVMATIMILYRDSVLLFLFGG